MFFLCFFFPGVEVFQWCKKLHLFLLIYGLSTASATGTYAAAWVLIHIAVALMKYVFLKLLAVVAAAEIWKIEDFSK